MIRHLLLRVVTLQAHQPVCSTCPMLPINCPFSASAYRPFCTSFALCVHPLLQEAKTTTSTLQDHVLIRNNFYSIHCFFNQFNPVSPSIYVISHPTDRGSGLSLCTCRRRDNVCMGGGGPNVRCVVPRSPQVYEVRI